MDIEVVPNYFQLTHWAIAMYTSLIETKNLNELNLIKYSLKSIYAYILSLQNALLFFYYLDSILRMYVLGSLIINNDYNNYYYNNYHQINYLF